MKQNHSVGDRTRIPATTGGQDVAVVLATQAGLIIAGLAMQSVLAYTLLPEGRGSYAVCVMFGGLFGGLFSPGADRGAQYFVMKRRMSVSEGVAVALTICLIGAVLAVAVALPLIWSDLAFFQKADRASFLMALPLIPLTSFSTSMQLQLAGLRRFARLAFCSLFQTITNVALLLALVGVLGLGVRGALVAAGSGSLVMITLIVLDLRRDFGLKLAMPSGSACRRVIRYGVQYYVARVGQLVDVQIGGLFLAVVAGRAEIGLFAVASAFLQRVFIISNSVSSALLPRVAGDEGGRPGLVACCGRITAGATGVALAGLVALSVPMTRLLLSEAFLPAVRLIRIMAPGVLVYSGANVLMAYFRGVNRPGVCSWVVWAGLSANLGTVALLYPHVGVAAAAWGMTVGWVCRSAMLGIVYSGATGMNAIATWLPRRDDAKLLWDAARTAIGLGLRRASHDG